MKKIIVITLILATCLSLCACASCYHSSTSPATCTSQETCNYCGEMLNAALGHDYQNGYCTRCSSQDPNYFDVKDNPFLTIEQLNHDINSANGVDVEISFTNRAKKQIAYVFFTLKFYDRMGKPAYCEIKKDCTTTLQFTGPLNAGASKVANWSAVFYCSSTAAIQPQKIEIEYTDETRQIINCSGRYWYDRDSYYGGDLRE